METFTDDFLLIHSRHAPVLLLFIADLKLAKKQ